MILPSTKKNPMNVGVSPGIKRHLATDTTDIITTKKIQ